MLKMRVALCKLHLTKIDLFVLFFSKKCVPDSEKGLEAVPWVHLKASEHITGVLG